MPTTPCPQTTRVPRAPAGLARTLPTAARGGRAARASGTTARASARGRRASPPPAAAAPPAPAGPAAAPAPAPPRPAPEVLHYDFVVLGSGIAGLTFAVKAARHGRVAVVTKGALSEGCTAYAQGGVCAVLDTLDSWQSHAHDTIVAGAHLNAREAVEVVCQESAERVLELAAWGAAFTTAGADGALHLTREGGHSHRRIVHAADATGAEIQRALEALVRHEASGIDVFEGHHALDLVTGDVQGVRHCIGVDCLAPAPGGGPDRRVRFLAGATMLATGGAGQAYPATTNPATVTGDGIAMAFRAGVPVANMEFVQFHPTALYQEEPGEDGRAFLITEAVRGEGGLLLDWEGRRFMPAHDPRAELAPRDVVARAIAEEMARAGKPHMWLSIAHKGEAFVREHFPTIHEHLLGLGLDITREPIPVLPAQHYLCGGVATNLVGQTDLPGLFASGEVAHTGLHGANRLASNSLLEGLVFSHRAVSPAAAQTEFSAWFGSHARAAAEREALTGAPWEPRGAAPGAGDAPAAPPADCGELAALRPGAAGFTGEVDAGELRALRQCPGRLAAWTRRARAELSASLWEGAGIVRNGEALARSRGRILRVLAGARAVEAALGPSRALSEVINLATVADLIAWSAASREESRGGHFRSDAPRCSPGEAAPTVVSLAGSRGLGGKRAAGARGRGPERVALGDLAGLPAPDAREPLPRRRSRSPRRAGKAGRATVSVSVKTVSVEGSAARGARGASKPKPGPGFVQPREGAAREAVVPSATPDDLE